jgi:phage gpG-like protein
MPSVSTGKVPVVPGVGVEFDWGEVSPEELTYRLAKFEDYLENTQLLAETIQPGLQYDVAERFETETDPSGKPWKPLVRPATAQIGILQLSGDMRNKAISDAAWEATPAGIFFDTTVLPEYWAIHDMGYSSRIPKRQFIGISEVEADRIEGIGYKWMDMGMDSSFAISGKRSNVGRNALGRFTSLK